MYIYVVSRRLRAAVCVSGPCVSGVCAARHQCDRLHQTQVQRAVAGKHGDSQRLPGPLQRHLQLPHADQTRKV